MDFSKLSNDEFVEYIIKEHKKRNNKEFQEILRIRRKEDHFVTTQLRNAGYKVYSLFDLINFKQSDFGYITMLLDLLDSDDVTDPIIKDGLIRAITVKKAKGICEEKLLEYYHTLSTLKEKELIGTSVGNWFEYLYSDKYFSEIQEICLDRSNGISRHSFVLALGKTRKYKSEALEILTDLTYDEDVSLQAVIALGKLKSIKSIDRLTEMCKSERKIIQKEAKKALKKIKPE